MEDCFHAILRRWNITGYARFAPVFRRAAISDKFRSKAVGGRTMRSQSAPANPAAGDVTPAVLAIGRPDFPNVLIDTLRGQIEIDRSRLAAMACECHSTMCLEVEEIFLK
jgi:hypothetical protein